MYHETVGLIGGFGGYATLDFYRRFLEVFQTGRERDFPHIVIDNDFTMPSRTRSLLTGEGHDEIVEGICRSMRLLLSAGADHIILVCGTAHYFLEDVYRKIPEGKEKVLDIINTTGEELSKDHTENVFVMAAEGTLLQRLYPKRLKAYGITCDQPDESEYPEIRYFLECVKQGKITEETCNRFLAFAEKHHASDVILGCTELPVIANSPKMTGISGSGSGCRFHDPLEFTLKRLKEIIR